MRIGQSYQNIFGSEESQPIPEDLESYPIIKLGIQAPPGSIFQINGKNIQIGLNGIYELEEPGILITSLSPQNSDISYIIDYIQEGE